MTLIFVTLLWSRGATSRSFPTKSLDLFWDIGTLGHCPAMATSEFGLVVCGLSSAASTGSGTQLVSPLSGTWGGGWVSCSCFCFEFSMIWPYGFMISTNRQTLKQGFWMMGTPTSTRSARNSLFRLCVSFCFFFSWTFSGFLDFLDMAESVLGPGSTFLRSIVFEHTSSWSYDLPSGSW